MKLFLYMIYLVAIGFFLSCKKSSEIGDKVENIQITFLQRFIDGRTEPYLLCTGGSFDCRNVRIDFSFSKSDHTLYLDFGGTSGNDCSDGSYDSYPAYSYVYPGHLENGNYTLDVTNRGKSLHCQLKVESTKYTLTSGTCSTVSFNENPVVEHLVTADAIWGYVFSYPDTVKAHYFIDSLYSLGAVPYAPLLEDGDYEYFKLSNHNIVSMQMNGSNGSIHFPLKSSIDTAVVRNLVNFYGASDTIRSADIMTGTGKLITW